MLTKEGKTLYSISKPHISSQTAPVLEFNRIAIKMSDSLVYRLYYSQGEDQSPASAALDFGRLQVLLLGVYTISVLERNALYFVNPLTIAVRKGGQEVERIAIENIVSFDLSGNSIVIVDKNGNTHVLVYDTVESAQNDFDLYYTITDPLLAYEFYDAMGDNSVHKQTDNQLVFRNVYGNLVTTMPIREVLEVTIEGKDVILVHNHTRIVVLRYVDLNLALTARLIIIEAITPFPS
jgi:hypothetical protein